jgi:hypothetical protein
LLFVEEGADVGKKLLDRFALVGLSLLSIAAGTGVFLWADEHHISDASVYGAWASVIFLGIVGWPFRSKLKSPRFLAFLLVWLLIHVFIFLLVVSYLGFLYYIPAVLLELWVGYTLAILQFGPPQGRTLR